MQENELKLSSSVYKTLKLKSATTTWRNRGRKNTGVKKREKVGWKNIQSSKIYLDWHRNPGGCRAKTMIRTTDG